jgi:hypothetical protein
MEEIPRGAEEGLSKDVDRNVDVIGNSILP